MLTPAGGSPKIIDLSIQNTGALEGTERRVANETRLHNIQP